MIPVCAAMTVACSRSPWSVAQRNPARRLANSLSTQSSETALFRSVPDLPVEHHLVGEVGDVTVPYCCDRSRRGELFLGELADRFQQAVAGDAVDLLGSHQRLAHQRVDEIQDGEVIADAVHG